MYVAPAGAWARLRVGCLRKPPKASLRLLGRGLSLRHRLLDKNTETETFDDRLGDLTMAEEENNGSVTVWTAPSSNAALN